MKPKRTWQVKEVAKLTGVSVRALHHYDEIGLLAPSDRTGAGYRLYDEADLLRLQQILIGRALGLPLEEIRKSLDEPGFDRKRALREQREQLLRRAQETAGMIRAVDHALGLLEGKPEGETKMEPLFEGFDPQQHEAEAEQRWGDTAAFKESKRRTAKYTPDDWKRMKAEQAQIYTDAMAAKTAGKPVDSHEMRAIVERHRGVIDRWFYPCDAKMQRNLADLYEADARFAANIDAHGEGLTAYLVAAIRAA